MSMDTSGQCQFGLRGKWTKETVDLLNRAVAGWWGDWLEYADDLFTWLVFDAGKPEGTRLGWNSDSSVEFSDMVGFSAGGKACVPHLGDMGCEDLMDRENFDPEIHQTLLQKMNEQRLEIVVKYTLEYVEGTEGELDWENWSEDEFFYEFSIRCTLSSDGENFILK